MASPVPNPAAAPLCQATAYVNCDSTTKFGTATPLWLNKGDNAWQMTAATLVGMQSVPGLVILYGSIVKKKWAVNSAFMAFYAFAATLLTWVLWAYQMSFGAKLIPFWGKGGVALKHQFLLAQSIVPNFTYVRDDSLYGHWTTPPVQQYFPVATMVYFQFVFAAITVILVAGSLLGRMNFHAWLLFVPLWVTFSYSVGAFCLFGGGFLNQLGVVDYSGGYVIHLSSGIAGITAAYWVGPRLKSDRDRFPPNNIILMLAGAGLLWMGWTGFNGGDPYAATIDASMAVLNTHVCTATSLLVWLALDIYFFEKPSVIGAVQGMVTGLVCITPAAGVIEGWAAIIFGLCSGSIPWFTMMILHKRTWLKNVDDVMAVFHTHAVAGTLGGLLSGVFVEPTLNSLFGPVQHVHGLFYPWKGNGGFRRGIYQVSLQFLGAAFIIGWNLVVTTIICQVIPLLRIPLRLSEEQLEAGDDAVHGEEAYALFGDGATLQDYSQSVKSNYDEEQSKKFGSELTEMDKVGKGDPAFSPA